MSRYSFLFLFFLLIASFLSNAQDTIPPKPVDTPPPSPVTIINPPREAPPQVKPNPLADSFSKKPEWIPQGWALNNQLPFHVQILEHHPFYGFAAQRIIPGRIQAKQEKETIFYVLVGLLLLFSFLREAFTKYFNDLFRLFFRTTLKYRQIREQLMQTPLPSLLFNGFFVLSAGLYIGFILLHFELVDPGEFWRYVLYSSLGLATLYFLKFLALKVAGWIFNLIETAESYIFVVFVINKIIGIFLLPFTILLAFTKGFIYELALVMSWFGIGVLILYRFILSYAAIRNQVRLNPFQFLLYILAFEVAPVLLIYKLLLVFFN